MSQKKENGTLQSAASNVVKYPNNKAYHNTIPTPGIPVSLEQVLNFCLIRKDRLESYEVAFLEGVKYMYEAGSLDPEFFNQVKDGLCVLMEKCFLMAEGKL